MITWDIASDVGFELGTALAETFGDEEMKEYYENYSSWDKVWPELKDAWENGNFWDGFDRMLGAYVSGDESGDTKFSESEAKDKMLDKAEDICNTINQFASDVVNTLEIEGTVLKTAWDNKWTYIWKGLTDVVEGGKGSEFMAKLKNKLDEYYREYTVMWKDFTDKIKKASYEGSTGITLSSEANYEFDSNGGIKYAYSNGKTSANNAIAKTTQTIVLALETKLNNGEITESQFKAIIETYQALQKLAGKKSSKYDINFGGDISSTNSIKEAKEAVEGLAGFFTNKDADYDLDVSGDVNNKNDIDKLSGSMGNLRDKWKNKDATMNAKTAVNGATGGGVAALGKLATDFETNLRSKWKDKDAYMRAKTEGIDTSKKDYKGLSDIWKDRDAYFTAKFSDNANTNSTEYKKFCELWDNWYGRSANFGVSFNISGIPDVQSALNKVVDDLNSKLSAAGVQIKVDYQKIQVHAQGGVANKPTLGIFGEAGSEALVPLENNLGWLSKMSDMMITGMEESPKFGAVVSPPSTNFASNNYSGMAGNSQSDYLLEQLIRETQAQSDLLEQIVEKPSGITSDEVFRAVRTESKGFYKRTGSSPFNFGY